MHKNNKSILAILSFFLIVFSSISLVNHYFFRTYAWDLGIEANALFDYAHFRWNDCMLMQPQYKNVLSDHFSILSFLMIPFSYFLKTYSLLVFQIISILFGGYGIFRYFSIKTEDAILPLFATIHFFCIWGIYSALSFDYHHNVVGAMLIPWIFYFTEKRSWLKLSLCFLLMLLSKESMALFAGFTVINLLLIHRKNKKSVFILTGLAIVAFLYFVIIVDFVMPSLANAGRGFNHFNYSPLGAGPKEALEFAIHKPLKALSYLFLNTELEPGYDSFKKEFYFMFLVSGGIFILLKPNYLIILLPLLAQKMFHESHSKWGLANQYSIEFVPILSLLLFESVLLLKKGRIPVSITFIALTMFFTIYSIEKADSLDYNKEVRRFYSPEHYYRSFSIPTLNKALETIPINAIVSASNEIVSHLVWRNNIYLFPVTDNVEYIVLLTHASTYPLEENEYYELIEKLKTSGYWNLIYDNNNTLIFKSK